MTITYDGNIEVIIYHAYDTNHSWMGSFEYITEAQQFIDSIGGGYIDIEKTVYFE